MKHALVIAALLVGCGDDELTLGEFEPCLDPEGAECEVACNQAVADGEATDGCLAATSPTTGAAGTCVHDNGTPTPNDDTGGVRVNGVEGCCLPTGVRYHWYECD